MINITKKQKIILIVFYFSSFVILVSLMFFFLLKFEKKIKKSSETLELFKKEYVGKDYKERLEFKSEKITSGAKIQGDFLKILNSSNAVRRVGIDVSTPAREAIFKFLLTTLRELGYTLIIFNQDSLNEKFLESGQRSQIEDCGRFSYYILHNNKEIDIYFLITDSNGLCPKINLMKPVVMAISEIKGSNDWWKSGVGEVLKEFGGVYLADDAPLVFFAP